MTMKDIAAIARGLAPLFQAIAARLAALELKDKGLDGAPGPRGPAGPQGPAGRDGRDGLPGVPGEKGQDGKHGRDGQDGLGFDDLVILHDGARNVTFRFVQGDRIKETTVTFPVVLDQGVFKAGQAYQKGDGVTWAGSFWIAQAPTTDKPGDGATAWRLAVKAGREGKAGPVGPAGRDGQDGRPGRDLTQMDTTGRKW